jgi:hypothetical protein
VPIKFGSLVIRTTLLILGLDSVDIILGTDWVIQASGSIGYCSKGH